MRISKIILIGMILTVMLTGCFNKKNSEINNNESLLNSTIDYSSFENTTELNKDFTFNTSLNAFYNNSSYTPLENKIEINKNELVNIKVLTNVTTDKSMYTEYAPMRMWILADGKPIEFCINNNDKYKIFNDIFVEVANDNLTDVSFNCSYDVNIITKVCVYFPEDIPERGLGSYSGEISYTILNSAHSIDDNLKNSNSNSNFYINIPKKEEYYGIDIGELTVKDNDNRALETHFYNDVLLTNENKNLYVKFNSGDKKEISYYILVLCDGMLVDIFDGNYSYEVNCLNGSRTYQYCIPNNYIPDSGLHTFQAIAIPADKSEDLTSYSTPKIRVQIS